MKTKIKNSLQRLVKRLVRYLALSIKLTPISGLGKLAPKQWYATHNDPYFVIKSRFPLWSGWYLVALKLQHESNGSRVAKLYLDLGQDFSEQNAISLPVRPNRMTYRVFHASQRIKTLRFDPVEDEGAFVLTHFQLFYLPRFQAQHWMLRRLSGLHPFYSNLSMPALKKQLHHQAKEQNIAYLQLVETQYNQTFSQRISDISYSEWRSQHQYRLQQQRPHIVPSYPLISILLPLYNSNVDYLSQCVTSVLQQSYPHWQLCVVDDGSSQHAHLNLMAQYAQQDARILFEVSAFNGHISRASNAALALAKGSFVLLLDHDDLLHEDTLMLMASALQQHPEALLIYADEDKVDEAGHHYQPHFKPDWNPDLLFSQNYIGHPVLLKTEHLRAMGGFRVGYEGSQDHDVLLRYTSGLSSRQIIHLPYVLYHWRSIAESTASNPSAKSYTTQAGIRALTDYFSQAELAVQVSAGKHPNTYRCQWALPEHPPLVSLIMPTKDNYDVVKTCVDSILASTDYPNYELLIMDNQTTCAKTLAYFEQINKKYERVRIIRWNHPFNYSAINNDAVSLAYGDVLCLVNNDLEVIHEDWLTEMVSHALRPEIGCVGAKLYYPNDTIQHAGVILGVGGVAGHSHKYFAKEQEGYFGRLHLTQNYSAVTAACLVLRKSVFQEVGGFDAENLTVAFNDVDLCLKVREAGYRNLFTPYSELYHHESVSRGAEDTPEKLKRAHAEVAFMKEKWQDQLLNDPAYNQNLSLIYENFSLR